MNADDAYRWLTESAAHGAGALGAYDAFDIHVPAAVLALAIDEAEETGGSICEKAGLDGAALQMLAGQVFPAAAGELDALAGTGELAVDEEEQSLRDILWMYATEGSALERHLAAMIARRCRSPHHLWQDLGLRNRGELSTLMQRHFTRLAERNSSDMKWKKFLYRMVCRSEGFSLCTAPVCTECDDFADCFGAEDGEALFARNRNAPAGAPAH